MNVTFVAFAVFQNIHLVQARLLHMPFLPCYCLKISLLFNKSYITCVSFLLDAKKNWFNKKCLRIKTNLQIGSLCGFQTKSSLVLNFFCLQGWSMWFQFLSCLVPQPPKKTFIPLSFLFIINFLSHTHTYEPKISSPTHKNIYARERERDVGRGWGF